MRFYEERKNNVFCDIDDTLIYPDPLNVTKSIFNDSLIKALKVASVNEIYLITSMNLRDVPERERLISHLEANGIKVKKVITSLDLRCDGDIKLGRAWRRIKGKVTYSEGFVGFKDCVEEAERLEILKYNIRSSSESGDPQEGRKYRRSDKNILLKKFLEGLSAKENFIFFEDSMPQLASIRDAFEPDVDNIKKNNELYDDAGGLRADLTSLQMDSKFGQVITHHSKKEPERNTFEEYVLSLIKLKTVGMRELSRINFCHTFSSQVYENPSRSEEIAKDIFEAIERSRQRCEKHNSWVAKRISERENQYSTLSK